MEFYKYQGAGNDFILIDQREQQRIAPTDREHIAALCHRRFGIGADGLILLQLHPDYDFEMIYFNADGGEGSMCGNGGRCVTAFARHLGIIGPECRFVASDGEHEARLLAGPSPQTEWVELKLRDVSALEMPGAGTYVLDTGSPHYVQFVPDNLSELDVFAEGRRIRNSPAFAAAGINVNFVQPLSDTLYAIRTYERGVEDETLACGTGVTAAALAAYRRNGGGPGQAEIRLKALGGELSVRFQSLADGSFKNVWLCGPAQFVFKGSL